MPRTRLRHFILHSILFHIFLGVLITLALIYLFDKETGSSGGQAGGRLEPIVVTVIDESRDSEKSSPESDTKEITEEEEKPEDVVEQVTELPEEEAVKQEPEIKTVAIQKKPQQKAQASQKKPAESEIQEDAPSEPSEGKEIAANEPGRLSEIETDSPSPGEVALNMTQGARPDYGLNPTPPYPKSARRRGYEGTVLLRVLVLENGKVGEIEVKSPSGHSVLDDSALKAVKDWTFIPGKKAGQSVSSWVEVPIKYQLDSG